MTTAQLTLNPASLAFGTVLVGASDTLSIQISNPGPTAKTIDAASISGPGFNVSGLALPLNLAAGQTATFAVVFAPSCAGSVTGQVDLHNSGEVLATLGLSGTGAVPKQHTATLAWGASTSVVDSYNVYRGTQSGGPYAKIESVGGTVLRASDSSVVSGQTYYYVITAVTGSVESPYSKEVVAAIPVP